MNIQLDKTTTKEQERLDRIMKMSPFMLAMTSSVDEYRHLMACEHLHTELDRYTRSTEE